MRANMDSQRSAQGQASDGAPRGTVDAFDGVTDPQGAELSRADAIDPAHTAARRRRVGPTG